MKKNVLALRVMICLWFMTSMMPSWAQTISEYEFNSYAGTFTAVANGIAPPLSGSTDNGGYQGIPIGFTFPFAGSNYTTVAASVNGFVRLGFDINLGEFTQNNLLATNSVTGVLLAPLWDDLSIANGTFHYKTTGVAPNRVLTLQWLNMRWNVSAASAGISFQVKLYENSGKIEYIYRQEAGAVNSGTASIGIRGSGSGANNFLSIQSTSPKPKVSSTLETTGLNIKPLTGQVYVFEPDGIPFAPVVRSNGVSLDLGYGNAAFTLEEKIGENGTYQPVITTTNNVYTIGNDYANVRFYRIKKGNSAYSPELRMDPWKIANYGFTASQGSFVPLSGAVIPTAQNNMYHHIPIGFPFRYPQSTFTTVSVNGLGEVFFGMDARGYFYSDPLDDDEVPKLSPLGGQLLSTGTFSYKTTGTSPNRIFTMEWLNVKWSASAAQPVISFQVKMYESTGRIEYIYRQEAGNVSSGGATIGLRGFNTSNNGGDLLALKSATADPNITSSSSASINYKPFTGQVYSFEPNGTPPAPRVELMGASSMSLNLGFGYPLSSFILEQKVGDTGDWTVIQQTTVPNNVTVLFNSDQVHYYRVKKGQELPYSPVLRVNPTQFNQYTFAASSGSYSPLIGGIPASSQAMYNEDFYNHIPIGFDFPYHGVWFNRVSVNERGQIVFNRDGDITSVNNPLSNYQDAMLVPLGDMLGITSVNYKTQGIAPARVFTLECSGVKWNYVAAAGISFQVKLYENTGKIQFIYKPESGALNTPSAIVGLRGIGNLFNNYFSLNSFGPAPEVLWNTENNTIGAKPANGQTYTFVIPNAAPQAYDATIMIAEDQTVTGFMQASDADGNTLQYTITQENSALHTLSGTMPNLTYTPLAEYSGTDTIKFKVSDGIVESAEATIVFVITPVNDPPVSSDDWINMIQNTVYTFAPADFNYSDVEGHAWTGMRIVSLETDGDLEYNNTDVVANVEYAYPAGTLVFKPVPGTSGVPYASFTFQLKDAQGAWSQVYTMGISVHCAPPVNATASSITATSALISWQDPNNTGNYEVMYRPVGSTSWLKVSTNQLSQLLTGLTSNVQYEYRVRAICSGDVYSIGEPVNTFVTTVNYIDLVNLGTINNVSGQSSYTSYLNLSTTVTLSNSFTLQYSGAGSGNKKYYKAWIDYNLNGFFESPDEEILSSYTATLTTLSQVFVVPAWATPGTSRLRVAVSFYPITDSGNSIPTGEVEDYTVVIYDPYGGGSSFRSMTPHTPANTSPVEPAVAEIAPNPVKNQLVIQAPSVYRTGNMLIATETGLIVYEGKFTDRMDASGWKKGLYVVRLMGQNGIVTLKFIKE
jgi:hypothetical protein